MEFTSEFPEVDSFKVTNDNPNYLNQTSKPT